VADLEGADATILTGCILKQVKMLHKNTLFMDRILTNFMGRGYAPYAPSPNHTIYLNFCSLFQNSGSATGQNWKNVKHLKIFF